MRWLSTLSAPGAAAAAADEAGDHLRRLAVHHLVQPRPAAPGAGARRRPAGARCPRKTTAGTTPGWTAPGSRRTPPSWRRAAGRPCHDVVRPGGHARDQQGIFRYGFTPAGLAIVTCPPARSARPHRCARAMTGTRPARDTRSGSSNDACVFAGTAPLTSAHHAAGRRVRGRQVPERGLSHQVGFGVADPRTGARTRSTCMTRTGICSPCPQAGPMSPRRTRSW